MSAFNLAPNRRKHTTFQEEYLTKQMENGSAEKLTVETGEIADLRCLLFYPPGDAYQRGEDRSQGNISDSAATVVRAPNDMGYACAILKKLGCSVSFVDFQTEGKQESDLLKYCNEWQPDVVVTSTTNSTVFDDIAVLGKIKALKKNIVIIVKGAIF